jgi:hypothetical protein
MPGEPTGAWSNLPDSELFWQKEPVPIWPDVTFPQKRAVDLHYF